MAKWSMAVDVNGKSVPIGEATGLVMKEKFEMGALWRGDFRSLLLRLQHEYPGTTFTEDRHLISSMFYVTTDSLPVVNEINRMLERNQRILHESRNH